MKDAGPHAAVGGPALFRSAHQALLFACTFASTQHGDAGAAERLIALQARDRYERHPGSGRGLHGLDGAAQAGMILSLVARLPRDHQLVIEARFRVLDPALRTAACRVLALRARAADALNPALRSRPDALLAILKRYFGLRSNLLRVADAHDVDERTVRRWQVEVLRWAKRLEGATMNGAEDALQAAGIVGPGP